MGGLCFLPLHPQYRETHELHSANQTHHRRLLKEWSTWARSKVAECAASICGQTKAKWPWLWLPGLEHPDPGRAAAPRRAGSTGQHWQPFPETRPPSFFHPPDDLLSYLFPLINPFVLTLSRLDLSIWNQKPWPMRRAHIPFIISHTRAKTERNKWYTCLSL